MSTNSKSGADAPIPGSIDPSRSNWMGRVQKARIVILWVLILSALALQIFVQSAFEPNSLIHELVEWLGVFMIAICILGRMWSSLYIGGRKSVELVRNGPYAISRNPLYLFSIIGAAGAAAQSGSITLMLLTGALTWLVFRILISREEGYLEGIHGDAYRAYVAAVPRIFPRSLNAPNDETLVVSPRRVMQTGLDSMVFFIALPIMEIVEELQEAGVIAVKVLLP
jgi:protein-S-isoprenylcysteine O-methyltransferase Ste14